MTAGNSWCTGESGSKRDRVYQVFESISANYDAANTRISLGLQDRWKKQLVREILGRTRPTDRLLDVCCGTGDIALALAAARPDCRVDGIDFSPAMLEVARRKGCGLGNLVFAQGDAMKLPFPDGTFQAAAISFGLRNTACYGQVLGEMERVLKPGGTLYCLDSFVPDGAAVRPFYRFYFRRLMPLFGGGYRYRREYRWLWQSTEDFLRKKQLTQLLEQTGMRGGSCRSYLFGACALHMAQKCDD